MRRHHSAWPFMSSMLLAVVTAAPNPLSAQDAAEAHIRAIVNTLYAKWSDTLPPGSARAPEPGYSPSTAAMIRQYDASLRKDNPEQLPEFKNWNIYIECPDYCPNQTLQSVTVTRVAPDLIDATMHYLLWEGDSVTRTRIRFQNSGSWKVHDVFWADGSTLRGFMAGAIARHRASVRPGVAASESSAPQKPTVIAPSVAQNPAVTGASVAPEVPAPVLSACGDNPRCAEVSTFVATVTDLRESVSPTSYSAPIRLIGATIRIRNSTRAPIALGYVTGSGVVTDDRGNRYVVEEPRGVRGIGVLGAGPIDPKFTLRPGESGDVRFEFSLQPRGAVIGTQYVVEMAIREIESIEGQQWRLGREYALQFRGFGGPAAVAASTAAQPAPVLKPDGGAVAASTEDVCAKKPDCFSAGPFVAEITRMSTSVADRYFREIQYTVRFRNLTAQPLALAETPGSSLVVDDRGNRYTPNWIANKEVMGMGVARGQQSDASFVLAPGTSSEATFTVRFNVGKAVLGSVYDVDFAVEELELLPANQVRSVRQYAVGFREVKIARWRGIRNLIDIRIGKP